MLNFDEPEKVVRIKDTEKSMTFNEVFQLMTPFIQKQVNRTMAALDTRSRYLYDSDDVFQLYSEAIFMAYDQYDINKNVQFATFAYWKICAMRKSILKHMYAKKRSVQQDFFSLDAANEIGSLEDYLQSEMSNSIVNDSGDIQTNDIPVEDKLIISDYRETQDPLNRAIIDNFMGALGFNGEEIAKMFSTSRQVVRYRLNKIRAEIRTVLELD